MKELRIRPFVYADREILRSIACDTAFIGEPCEAFFQGRGILADFLTAYFIDYEPQSCFVAEVEKQVVGYIIGAKDERLMSKVFFFKILPHLLKNAICAGAVLKKKNIKFILNSLMSFLKGEFKAPDFHRDYPATLHINLKEDFRNLGLGSELMVRFLNYLRQENVKAVHLATLSDRGAKFFQKQGFKLLYKTDRSYFKHVLNRQINCYYYGKKI